MRCRTWGSACTHTHLQPGRYSEVCGTHLEDELQLVLVALEHALEGLGGHEQQHARETIVQDDGHVVDVHAADDQHRVFGIAAVDRLETRHRSKHTCTNSELRGRTRSAARTSARSVQVPMPPWVSMLPYRLRALSFSRTFGGFWTFVDVRAVADEHWVAVAAVVHLENRRSVAFSNCQCLVCNDCSVPTSAIRLANSMLMTHLIRGLTCRTAHHGHVGFAR